MAEQVKNRDSARLVYQVNLFVKETGGILTDITAKGDKCCSFKFVHISKFFKGERICATEFLMSEIEEMARYCFWNCSVVWNEDKSSFRVYH